MSILGSIKNLIHKGGELMGMNTGLDSIIDDPRIALTQDEVTRIQIAKRYYQNDLEPYHLINSYGEHFDAPVQPLNVAFEASKDMASLVFNEGCSIKINNDTDAQEFLDQVLLDNNFQENAQRKLQRWFGLGTGLVSPTVSNDQIVLRWASAGEIYPLKANSNDVNEVAIAFRTIRTEERQTVYYTLLEFHQWTDQGYQISNELYRSTDQSTVGTQVPLAALPEYANLSQKITFQGTPVQLFGFYRNPADNNKNLTSAMGLSMIDNCKSTIDALNRANTELTWEMKQGQRRIIVPESFLGKENLAGMPHPNGKFNPRPRMYDPDEMVYQVGYGLEDDTIKDVTSDIRVDDFDKLTQHYLSQFENQTGFSQGTFTATPSGIQTATEVVSNNSKTYQTRSSYITQVEKAFKQMVRAIMAEAATPELWSDGEKRWDGDPDALDITIDFNDGVFVNKEQQKTDDLQAVTAGIMPKVQYLVRNYDLDETTAEQWLAEVKNENPVNPVPDQEADAFGYGSDDGSDDDSDSGGDNGDETDTGEDSESS